MASKKLLFTLLVFFIIQGVSAQDTSKANHDKDTTDLMSQLEKSSGKKTVYAAATFGYTRVITGHSVENLPAHVLDVRISHRFGPLKNGAYQFFGLDNGYFNVRIGFDYGITNNFMVGVGHNAFQKTYDGFFKIKLLKQSSVTGMPLTVSFVSTFATNTIKAGDFGFEPSDSLAKMDRMSYVLQLLIARKFTEGLSVQVMPTFIHLDNISFNHFKNNDYKQDVAAIGIAAQQKVSKRMSLSAEYYYQLPATQSPLSQNVLSVGLGIGTGGHVFQLQFTNSIGLTEKSFIAENYKHGDISGTRFGFNISRVFQFGKKHKGESKDWKK